MENEESCRPPTTAESGTPDAASLKSFDNLLEDIGFLFHEIRTPLTAIIGYAKFLQEQPQPAHEQQALLDIIAREAQHIDNLLNDFSEGYRQENRAWLTEVALATIDVGNLLLEVVTRFKDEFVKQAMRVEVPDGLPPVRGDAEKLYMVIRNLLANAIKYSPDGGEITVSAAASSSEVVIKVRDQGVGIPADQLPKIFNRGFRVKLSGDNGSRGSGLGLTMVKRIIEAHNGKIFVESEEGRGTLFLISLPRLG